MKTAESIDWPRVEEAMRRSKLGVASADDADVCATAYKAAPAEYARRKRVVDEDVHREERAKWG